MTRPLCFPSSQSLRDFRGYLIQSGRASTEMAFLFTTPNRNGEKRKEKCRHTSSARSATLSEQFVMSVTSSFPLLASLTRKNRSRYRQPSKPRYSFRCSQKVRPHGKPIWTDLPETPNATDPLWPSVPVPGPLSHFSTAQESTV